MCGGTAGYRGQPWGTWGWRCAVQWSSAWTLRGTPVERGSDGRAGAVGPLLKFVPGHSQTEGLLGVLQIAFKYVFGLTHRMQEQPLI